MYGVDTKATVDGGFLNRLKNDFNALNRSLRDEASVLGIGSVLDASEGYQCTENNFTQMLRIPLLGFELVDTILQCPIVLS